MRPAMPKIALGLMLGLVLLAPAPAAAQSWPQKPIKMIVPFPAGGGTDFIGRLAAKHLSDRLGQQVFVENRGGANGAIGLQALMQSDPDGYTIATSSDTPLVVNPWLYDKLPYQALLDFVPVATLVRFPGMLAVHPSVPATSVAELIALAKAKPGSLAYASAGVGNFSHLAMELFSLATGVKLLHVPYKGTGPASLALIGGDVQLGFNNVQTLLQNVRGGQLPVLAVAEPQRVAALPDVPTVAETVPGFSMAPWIGIIVPVKTPKEVVARLGEATLAVMHDPEVIKVLNEQQVTPMPTGSEEFEGLIKKDLDRWANVIKTAGIKGEESAEGPHVRSSLEPGAAGNPRHGARFRGAGSQAAGPRPRAARGADAAVAHGRARQGGAARAAHAGAVRGRGWRGRRSSHLLHRHRGARRRRPRHRGRARADLDARACLVRPADDAAAARTLPAGLPRRRSLSPRARAARAGARCHPRDQLSSRRGERRELQHHGAARGRRLGDQRPQGTRRQRAHRQAVRGRGEHRDGRCRHAPGAVRHVGTARDE